jgi:hypothetical protein
MQVEQPGDYAVLTAHGVGALNLKVHAVPLCIPPGVSRIGYLTTVPAC